MSCDQSHDIYICPSAVSGDTPIQQPFRTQVCYTQCLLCSDLRQPSRSTQHIEGTWHLNPAFTLSLSFSLSLVLLSTHNTSPLYVQSASCSALVLCQSYETWVITIMTTMVISTPQHIIIMNFFCWSESKTWASTRAGNGGKWKKNMGRNGRK